MGGGEAGTRRLLIPKIPNPHSKQNPQEKWPTKTADFQKKTGRLWGGKARHFSWSITHPPKMTKNVLFDVLIFESARVPENENEENQTRILDAISIQLMCAIIRVCWRVSIQTAPPPKKCPKNMIFVIWGTKFG